MSDTSTDLDEVLDDEIEVSEGAEEEGEGQDAEGGEAEGQADSGDASEGEGDGRGSQGASQGQGVRRRGASDTIRELRERAQRAEQRANEVQAQTATELAALKARLQQVEGPRNDEERRNRLALMDPDQKAEFLVSEARTELGQQLQRLERQNAQALDRIQFDTLCQTDPLARKYRNDVENAIAAEAAQGRHHSRAVVLRWIIGDKVLQKAGKVRPGAQRRSQQQRAAQRANGSAGGSDAGTTRTGNAGAGRKQGESNADYLLRVGARF